MDEAPQLVVSHELRAADLLKEVPTQNIEDLLSTSNLEALGLLNGSSPSTVLSLSLPLPVHTPLGLPVPTTGWKVPVTTPGVSSAWRPTYPRELSGSLVIGFLLLCVFNTSE